MNESELLKEVICVLQRIDQKLTTLLDEKGWRSEARRRSRWEVAFAPVRRALHERQEELERLGRSEAAQTVKRVLTGLRRATEECSCNEGALEAMLSRSFSQWPLESLPRIGRMTIRSWPEAIKGWNPKLPKSAMPKLD